MSRVVAIFVILDVIGLIAMVLYVGRRKQRAHEIGPVREARGLQDLKPFFRPDVVERKVSSLFAGTERSEAIRLLNADLPATWGLERLQLALLKLSEGKLDELRRLVDAVTSDAGRSTSEYSRLICRAESPEAQGLGDEYVRLLPEEQEPIFRRDLRQYLRWVKQ